MKYIALGRVIGFWEDGEVFHDKKCLWFWMENKHRLCWKQIQ